MCGCVFTFLYPVLTSNCLAVHALCPPNSNLSILACVQIYFRAPQSKEFLISDMISWQNGITIHGLIIVVAHEVQVSFINDCTKVGVLVYIEIAFIVF